MENDLYLCPCHYKCRCERPQDARKPRAISAKAWIASSLLLLAMTMFFAISAQAQESVPGDACSTVNILRYAGGLETSGKGYIMTCQGGVWVRITESDTSGNLGIRQAAPKAPLHVGGEVIVGVSTGLACNADREGGIRYNTTGNSLELCDGTSWSAISVAACGDASPAAFDFTDLVNQTVSTLVTSNILQITSISCTVNVAVTGEGSPQLRTCSDATCSTVLIDWATTGTIDNNSYIQLRLTTSAAGGDTYSATLSVGTNADVWNATPVGSCSDPSPAGTVCADGTVYAGMSPDGNVKMYVTRCDAGMSWDGSACTGARFYLPWNNGDGNSPYYGYNSYITGESNTINIAPLDSNNVLAGTQDHVAIVYCNDLTQDGNSDWYLPAQQELNVLSGNSSVIKNFHSTASYWSSSEYNSTTARWVKIVSGDTWADSKNANKAVRCARK